jgi:hypothetical protein
MIVDITERKNTEDALRESDDCSVFATGMDTGVGFARTPERGEARTAESRTGTASAKTLANYARFAEEMIALEGSRNVGNGAHQHFPSC